MAISKRWGFWLWVAKLLPKKLQYACWIYVLARGATSASVVLSQETVAERFWSDHD